MDTSMEQIKLRNKLLKIDALAQCGLGFFVPIYTCDATIITARKKLIFFVPPAPRRITFEAQRNTHLNF